MLEAGTTDEQILNHAADADAVVLTHDDDFLTADAGESVPVLYYADDTLSVSEIVQHVQRMIEYVPDPDELPTVTSLGDW